MTAILQSVWPSLALLAVSALFFLLVRHRESPVSTLEALFAQGRPLVVEMFNKT